MKISDITRFDRTKAIEQRVSSMLIHTLFGYDLAQPQFNAQDGIGRH